MYLYIKRRSKRVPHDIWRVGQAKDSWVYTAYPCSSEMTGRVYFYGRQNAEQSTSRRVQVLRIIYAYWEDKADHELTIILEDEADSPCCVRTSVLAVFSKKP